MGSHKHARVVINGTQLYNLGGDTCKTLIEQINRPGWHPLTEDNYDLTLGLGSFDKHQVRSITILIIKITQSHKRRITGMYQYWYESGPDSPSKVYIKHRVEPFVFHDAKWIPAFFDKNDMTYRILLNHVDMRISEDENTLQWSRSRDASKSLLNGTKFEHCEIRKSQPLNLFYKFLNIFNK